MKKTFKTIKTDAGKLQVELRHEFHPLKADPDVTVVVDHIRNGELINFMDMGTREINYPKLFLAKVKEVRGIEVEGADGEPVELTKEDVVNIADPDFLTIVMSTCVHLVGGMTLTEAESKN